MAEQEWTVEMERRRVTETRTAWVRAHTLQEWVLGQEWRTSEMLSAVGALLMNQGRAQAVGGLPEAARGSFEELVQCMARAFHASVAELPVATRVWIMGTILFGEGVTTRVMGCGCGQTVRCRSCPEETGSGSGPSASGGGRRAFLERL